MFETLPPEWTLIGILAWLFVMIPTINYWVNLSRKIWENRDKLIKKIWENRDKLIRTYIGIEKNWNRIENVSMYSLFAGSTSWFIIQLSYGMVGMINNLSLGNLGDLTNQPLLIQIPIISLAIGLIVFLYWFCFTFARISVKEILKIVTNPKYDPNK